MIDYGVLLPCTKVHSLIYGLTYRQEVAQTACNNMHANYYIRRIKLVSHYISTACTVACRAADWSGGWRFLVSCSYSYSRVANRHVITLLNRYRINLATTAVVLMSLKSSTNR